MPKKVPVWEQERRRKRKTQWKKKKAELVRVQNQGVLRKARHER